MPQRLYGATLRSLRQGQTSSRSSLPQVARRHASSSTASLPRRFLSTTLVLGVSGALVAYYYDSRSLLHEHVAMPIMRLVDPETGHKAAIKLLSSGKVFRPRDLGEDTPELHTEVGSLRSYQGWGTLG